MHACTHTRTHARMHAHTQSIFLLLFFKAMLAASVLLTEHNNFCNKLSLLSQIQKSFSKIKTYVLTRVWIEKFMPRTKKNF